MYDQRKVSPSADLNLRHRRWGQTHPERHHI